MRTAAGETKGATTSERTTSERARAALKSGMTGEERDERATGVCCTLLTPSPLLFTHVCGGAPPLTHAYHTRIGQELKNAKKLNFGDDSATIKEIEKRCGANKVCFLDPDFPPTERSLYTKDKQDCVMSDGKPITWRRPSDFMKANTYVPERSEWRQVETRAASRSSLARLSFTQNARKVAQNALRAAHSGYPRSQQRVLERSARTRALFLSHLLSLTLASLAGTPSSREALSRTTSGRARSPTVGSCARCPVSLSSRSSS